MNVNKFVSSWHRIVQDIAESDYGMGRTPRNRSLLQHSAVKAINRAGLWSLLKGQSRKILRTGEQSLHRIRQDFKNHKMLTQRCPAHRVVSYNFRWNPNQILRPVRHGSKPDAMHENTRGRKSRDTLPLKQAAGWYTATLNDEFGNRKFILERKDQIHFSNK